MLAPPPPDPFARFRTLVLDSSYRPIDVINWQRAICLTIFDKVGRPPPRPRCGRPGRQLRAPQTGADPLLGVISAWRTPLDFSIEMPQIYLPAPLERHSATAEILPTLVNKCKCPLYIARKHRTCLSGDRSVVPSVFAC